MKYFFIALIITLPTFAGTPDQDLIVDIMRERFKASSAQILEHDLKLNQTWTCVYYNARKGEVPNYQDYKNWFNFEKKENGVYINHGSSNFKTFSLHNGYLLATSGERKLHGRFVKEGTLMFEYTAPQYKIRKSYISVTDGVQAGHGYIYCKTLKK